MAMRVENKRIYHARSTRTPLKLSSSRIVVEPTFPSLTFSRPVLFRSSEDLMATLSIWDRTHHKVIHGMVWQVEPDRFVDEQSVIGEHYLVVG